MSKKFVDSEALDSFAKKFNEKISEELDNKADKSEIPTKLSDLENDLDLDSGGDCDLTGLQTKEDEGLNTEDKTIVGAINELDVESIKAEDFFDDDFDIELENNNGNISNIVNDIIKNCEIPTYNLKTITEEMGVTEGIQYVINEVNVTGKGTILLNETYEIDRPIVFERINENTNTSIEIYGGGCIKKSESFIGDQLVLLKIGFHDEDNIIFNNISFEGVDRTVNGVDTFVDLPYNEDCSNANQHNESKFVKFYNCSFNHCYHGARISSLSWVFSGCLFEYNNYGLYLDCAANANMFEGCSIRRNIVGVKIKEFTSYSGTVGNGFYNCTIEANNNVGIYSERSRDTKIIGCYFEENGYNIYDDYENEGEEAHIILRDSGGVGRHTIDSFFKTAKNGYDIIGHFIDSVVLHKSKMKIYRAKNSTFMNCSIDDITFIGMEGYPSEFYLNNELYISTNKAINKLIKHNENENNYIGTRTIYGWSQPKIENGTINIGNLILSSDIKINYMMNIEIFMRGRTASGNVVSKGVCKYDLYTFSSTGASISYNSNTTNEEFIDGGGGSSGSGYTTLNAFGSNPQIIINDLEGEDVGINIQINGINTTSMLNWGPATTIEAWIKINCDFISNSLIGYNDFIIDFYS